MKEITIKERLAIIENKVENIEKTTIRIEDYMQKICDKADKNTTDIKGIKAVGSFIASVIGIVIGYVFKRL